MVSLWGKNPNPKSEWAHFDKYGYWSAIDENHIILEVIDNSVMLVLAKKNPNRYKEIILGGSYDDGKYNDERCWSSYINCEEIYKI